MTNSKAVELNPDPIDPQPPQINMHKSNANKGLFLQGKLFSVTKTIAGNNFALKSTGTTVVQQAQPQAQSQVQQQSSQQQQFNNKVVPLQSQSTVQQVVAAPPVVIERQVPIQITLPAQGENQARQLTIHVPVSAIQSENI